LHDDLCELCLTAPEAGWLVELTKQLVAEHLCACGNITAPIRSVYRWKGRS